MKLNQHPLLIPATSQWKKKIMIFVASQNILATSRKKAMLYLNHAKRALVPGHPTGSWTTAPRRPWCFLQIGMWVWVGWGGWGGVGMLTFCYLAHLVYATQLCFFCPWTHGVCYATGVFASFTLWQWLWNSWTKVQIQTCVFANSMRFNHFFLWLFAVPHGFETQRPWALDDAPVGVTICLHVVLAL